jgi:Cys-rich repeat protein
MSKSRIVGGFVGLVVLLSGCGGADEGATKSEVVKKPKAKTPAPDETTRSSDSVDTDTSSTEPVDCVAPGAKGNSLGVGKYCQASADCAEGTFCTAGVAPKGAEFCTAFCATDADCGDGMTCFQEARGKGCAPTACLDP